MSIPVSQFVAVNPSVLPAGGSALDLIGLMLTNSTRVPMNGTDLPVILSFPTAAAVGAYFGLSSLEYTEAGVYFSGNDNSLSKPGALLIAQYNTSRVSAYLQGGNISNLTLAQLQAITGNLNVVVDGYGWDAEGINLSAATSFSNAATIITGDLALPSSASFTASIAPVVSGANTGDGLLTVTAVGSGTLAVGQIVGGSGVTTGTQIIASVSGTGGTGTYVVNISQTVASEAMTGTVPTASFTASIATSGGNGIMTVTAVASGTLARGLLVTGSGVAAGTSIISQLTGTAGSTGTYKVTVSQTVSSEAMAASAQAPTVTYDSVSGAFIVTSALNGLASSMQFATKNGATALLLTQATGAVLSQGAGIADPVGFMSNVVLTTQNWASFFLNFDPDGGTLPCTQKELFSSWTNSTNDRYIYCAKDFDPAATSTSTQPNSTFGSYLQTTNSSGTILTWDSGTNHYSAFVSGMIASIDFTQTNGRTTLAFKGQTGLVATVVDATSADNLAGNPQVAGSFGNGYNFYGAYATANQQFLLYQRGTISGPFEWADTYINQIWLNNALQLAVAELLVNIKSLPYNSAGYGLVRAACLNPINAAVNFGAIVPGVQLSAAQIAEINAAAGNTVAANTVATQGWYLQIVPAVAQVRQNRTSPPINLWWADGGSIQSLQIASITVQ